MLKNSVGITCDDSSGRMTISINNEVVSLLTVNSETPSNSNEEQINVNEFFRLDPDCQMLNINSFLQACKVAKEKYFNSQEVDLINYSVPPTNLDDIVNAEFEKKSIIPDPGLKNPKSKINHLSKPM